VRLDAPEAALPALDEFYADLLGFERAVGELTAFTVGATRFELRASAGRPFHHFALLAPGNRFGAALGWLEERVQLLPDGESGDVVFDFANWDASACYFHDPAGNIVELIAHRGIGETLAAASFSAGELLGFSELGLVGDTATIARELARIALELWDGTLSEEGRLAFVGERARTLILSPVGRPWLPTGRPAEAHPLEVVLTGPPESEVLVDGYSVSRGR
jgi:hypothetical protein